MKKNNALYDTKVHRIAQTATNKNVTLCDKCVRPTTCVTRKAACLRCEKTCM